MERLGLSRVRHKFPEALSRLGLDDHGEILCPYVSHLAQVMNGEIGK